MTTSDQQENHPHHAVTKEETITTQLWREKAQDDNPYAAEQCLCAGFDVYADLLRNASWIEYLFLLFQREQPSVDQSRLLNGLALAIGNPGPRDHSVQAAMSASAGGSNQAASLMAALAVGAGNLGGGREVALAMDLWSRCGTQLTAWHEQLEAQLQQSNAQPATTSHDGNRGYDSKSGSSSLEDVWLPMEHPAGFDPHGHRTSPMPVLQTLDYLAECSPGIHLCWLQQHRQELESCTAMPLAMSGVAAAAFTDLNLDPEQGEMLYLLLRLPGAAAHAVEQRQLGWKNYPFHGGELTVCNDPGASNRTVTTSATMSRASTHKSLTGEQCQ